MGGLSTDFPPAPERLIVPKSGSDFEPATFMSTLMNLIYDFVCKGMKKLRKTYFLSKKLCIFATILRERAAPRQFERARLHSVCTVLAS